MRRMLLPGALLGLLLAGPAPGADEAAAKAPSASATAARDWMEMRCFMKTP